MAIMTHAKFYFNRLMLTLIFGIPLGPGERLKRPGLMYRPKSSNEILPGVDLQILLLIE